MTKNQGMALLVLMLVWMTMSSVWAIGSVAVSVGNHHPAVEYKIEFLSATQVGLNRNGADGWEVVNARWARNAQADVWGYECIMQRTP